MSAPSAPAMPERFTVDVSLTLVGELTPIGCYNLTLTAQSARLDGRPTPIAAFLRTAAFHSKFMPVAVSFEGRLSALDSRK